MGLVFCLALVAVGILDIQAPRTPPIAFGIFWYFFASAPTSLFVLSEVENDHRMFFPFVGLMLSVTWAVALAGIQMDDRALRSDAKLSAACRLLRADPRRLCRRNLERNQIWLNEDAVLRRDHQEPENGRGFDELRSYVDGQRPDAPKALDYFIRATKFTPNYPTLEINSGHRLWHPESAARRRKRISAALSLAPFDSQTLFLLWALARRSAPHQRSHR